MMLLVGLLVLLSPLAHAHRPYAFKLAELSSPQGYPLILEELNGDGIVFEEPTSVQLRNGYGVVLAHTDALNHAWVYCPRLESCWVISYDVADFMPSLLRLNHKAIDYGMNPADEKTKSELGEKGLYAPVFYEGKSSVRSYDLGYPEMREAVLGFEEVHMPLRILSPFILAYNHGMALLVFGLVCYLPFFVAAWGYRKNIESLYPSRGYLLTIGLLLLLFYTPFAFFMLFIILWGLAVPVFHVMISALLAAIVGLSYLRREIQHHRKSSS